MGVIEIEARQVPLQTTPGGLWNEAFYRLVRNPGAIVGAVIVTSFIVVALFAPLLAPYSPTEVNLDLVADGCCPGPSWDHPMGVDDLGRDELSRVIYGARYSLLIGIVSVTVGLTGGTVARLRRGLLRPPRQPHHASRRHHARDSRVPDGDRDRGAHGPRPPLG